MSKRRKKEVEPTRLRLMKALMELDDPLLKEIVEAAGAGYYDDYESPLGTPLVQLCIDLKGFGHPEFIERVKDGEFDATAAESSAWMEREGRHILGASFTEDKAAARGGQALEMGDAQSITYLTRRLFALWKYMMADEKVEYSRADAMMVSHNIHMWILKDLLEDARLPADSKRAFYQTAVSTFKLRVDQEVGGG